MTHDLEVLRRFSGVEAATWAQHVPEWSIMLDWDPQKRYLRRPYTGAASPRHDRGGREAGEDVVLTTTELRAAMDYIAERKGEFLLFGLFTRSDAAGSTDLVVAAPWLEQGLKALRELAQLLSEALGEEAVGQISRIVTLDRNDPAFDAIVSEFPIDDGELRVQHSTVNGLEIDDAVVLRATRAA